MRGNTGFHRFHRTVGLGPGRGNPFVLSAFKQPVLDLSSRGTIGLEKPPLHGRLYVVVER